MKTLQEMTIEELRDQLVFEIGLKLHGYVHSTENIAALKAEIAERQYDDRDSIDIAIDVLRQRYSKPRQRSKSRPDILDPRDVAILGGDPSL